VAVRVGVDIGGTFTDFALVDDRDGRLVVHKQLTTPDDPARAVLEGLPVLLAKAGTVIEAVEALVHGTTLVTNAVIERKGARTGMLVTRGFSDVLDIAAERRYDMYDLRITYPEPLVPRALRVEIDERMDARGRPLRPVDPEEVQAAVRHLVLTHGIESLSVCFLNSPANPAHESTARRLVEASFGGLFVTTSAEVLPFLREYERWTTATMNAYAGPLFARYLAGLEDGLGSLGFRGAFYVMTSSGGTLAPEVARRFPVRMLESGPAAGVLMSARLGRALDRGELLAYDMGGTTAKGALVRRFQPLKRYAMEVARVHEHKAGSGLPVRIPVIDLIEIGAGGGSIAALDVRGSIRVGPRSAGASPGPACYAQGGDRPTLTDANLLLGYLDSDFFLGGAMRLDRAAAKRAIASAIAGPLGIDPLRAAFGIHETVNEDVARAFRNHAAERGFDYRRSAMIAFGGSGPAHAVRVARKLRVPTVILPVGAGVMSALGLLASPLAFEVLRSERLALDDLAPDGLARRFEPLVREASLSLPQGLARHLRVRRWLDMRYRGQGYEVEVELPDDLGPDPRHALESLFASTYAEVFAKSFPGEPVEIVAWKAEVAAPAPETGTLRLDHPPAGPAQKGHRPAYLPQERAMVEVPVYDAYALHPGDRLTGPALIEEREMTAVIGQGDSLLVDEGHNLVVTIALGDAA
jgi:N-methylhydantoinase A